MEERKCVPAPEQEEERNKAGARSRGGRTTNPPRQSNPDVGFFFFIKEDFMGQGTKYVICEQIG